MLATPEDVLKNEGGKPRRTIKLEKKGRGLGLRVTTQLNGFGTRVAELIEGGAAAQCTDNGGIKTGDKIIMVNGMYLENSTHDEVVAALKLFDEVVLVLEEDDSPLPTQTQVVTSSAASTKALSKTEAKADKKSSKKKKKESGQQRTVVLQRQPNKSLGLKILTYPTGKGARVSEIVPNGLASESDLQVGDRLVEINGRNVYNASHEAILDALRQSLQGSIHLLVETDPTTIDRGTLAAPRAAAVITGDPALVVNHRDITITRINGKLGFRFYSLLDAPFVFVSDIVPNSAAARTELKPDNVIVKINGEDVLNDGHDAVLRHLQSAGESVVLTVGDRVADDPAAAAEAAEAAAPNAAAAAAPNAAANAVALPAGKVYTDKRTVPLRRAEGESLGLKLKSWKDLEGVRIAYIAPGSAAAGSGLRHGDVLVEINGEAVLNKQHAEIIAMLVASPELELTVGTPVRRMVSLARTNDTTFGLQLEMKTGHLPIVLGMLPDTPAAAAAPLLKAGDRIVAVNSMSLRGLSENDILNALGVLEVDLELQAPGSSSS